MAERNFIVRTVAPATSTWTALVAPANCSYMTIVNQATVDVYLRTDSSNSSSQITIPAASSFDANVPVLFDPTPKNFRFARGETIAYFQLSASGSGNVIGVFSV